MSVIAVKKYKSKIIIGSDSQGTLYGSMKDTKTYADPERAKLFKCNGMMIGAVGSGEELGWMRLYAKTHKPKSSDQDDILEFMVGFVDYCLGFNSSFRPRNSYILIFENKVFTIHHCYDISEVKTFDSIGSGCFFALTSLYLGNDVKKSVQVAKELDLYCGGETILFEKRI